MLGLKSEALIDWILNVKYNWLSEGHDSYTF